MSVEEDGLARRVARERDFRDKVPVHVVWELTLACNLKCLHCGSRAGPRRPAELTTEEALDLVAQLAGLGTRELTVIGGEAYLRNDWVEIIRRATELGMSCSMQTGARALTPARLRAGADAGLRGIGVSIDGLRDLHDEVRGVPGAYANAFKVLRDAREAGLRVSVNTQIGARTIGELPALMDELVAAGVTHWQVQLTVAMGNAADHDELLLQPYRLAELMPLLARLHHEGQRHGLLMVPGNNIGYFGPYEHLWRNASSMSGHWSGCEAGHTALGIEADGTVKGCPSLPTSAYTAGNVRDLSVADMWRDSPALGFRRGRAGADELWGHCGTCYYADVCDAGCTWTAHSLLGRPGNNPYCHHRVLELAKKGIRERIVKVADASAAPFGIGEFALVEEAIPADPRPADPRPAVPGRAERAPGDRGVPELRLCGDCAHFVMAGDAACPFCSADVAEAEERARAVHRRRTELMDQVKALMRQET
ncbi:Antilisterial bacteriocin subtilosin biosynthesis protein AlbA [Nonomuraea coxensis DSM 45129]|uniref:Antilisterial bacteriocin subtilosin biosynthesis protein AlbA n=1 Tax=Nonomuraea coxensis DSM 45129 TaxID=1122611 RepID=A0ABX8U1C6_9ACTN|nr:GDL motif peptide-associated radical SAM/SPASM maturase [Nonomuraea coxensis]QYC41490.1 Antilisterial bacteriocin subtilosin biosynthesis protein AlbA [Nonomuraea coxensis DSM 45129]